MTDRHPRPHPKPNQLPAEIVTVLRRNAQEAMARHTAADDGGCTYCALTWLHTETAWPCPPVRIAHEFLRLTNPDGT